MARDCAQTKEPKHKLLPVGHHHKQKQKYCNSIKKSYGGILVDILLLPCRATSQIYFELPTNYTVTK